MLTAHVRIATCGFTPGEGGLPVEPFEMVRLTAGADYPRRPPDATVEHLRWLGFPHVLVGCILCLFLDVRREWDPTTEMAGVLQRLWGWMEDAIAGRFDPSTSLHHALGGVDHHAVGADTLVIGAGRAAMNPGIHKVVFRERSSKRLDVVAWDRDAGPGESVGIAIVTSDPLLQGVGATLEELVQRVDAPPRSWQGRGLPRQGFPDEAMLRARLHRAARALRPDEPLRILIAARNPAIDGEGAHDLAAGLVLPADLAASGLRGGAEPGELDKAQLVFMRPDDTRPEVLTRRDHDRPVSWYRGKWIHLFGCGALGSWIAEQVVRAGAARVTLSDPALVSRGLLVRQNFLEVDVGTNKAQALAERLCAVSDDTFIDVPDDLSGLTGPEGAHCDLIIDASVTHAVSAYLDALSVDGDQCPPLAQVATDSATATLGILTLSASGGVTLSAIQASIQRQVEADSRLEDFSRFWDPDDDGMFAPARGCSVPTFRGSAADAMGIASGAVSLLGPAVASGLVGGFVFALPHTAASVPLRTWLPHA